MIDKYLNPKFYDAGLSNDIPEATGDRYYAQDIMRDLRFFMDRAGLAVSDIVGKMPVLFSGGIVTQTAGPLGSLEITLGYGYAKFLVDIVNTFASLPPSVTTAYLDGVRIKWPAITALKSGHAHCSTYTVADGATTYYVKVKYVETDSSNTRARAKRSGTYAYEVNPDYMFYVDANAPSANNDELCLATLTSAAGVYTITQYAPHLYTPLSVAPIQSWATAVTYVSGQMVLKGSTVYVCNTGHTSGTFATDWYTSGYWTAIADPPGTVKEWGGANAPAGYLLCDNSAVSRTTYAELFAVLGTTYGAGDTTTTFNVPDRRGIGAIGAGTSAKLKDKNGAGNWLAGTRGTYYQDQMQGHVHPYGGTASAALLFGGANYEIQARNAGNPSDDGTNGTPSTGTYTRGPAVGMTYIIKY